MSRASGTFALVALLVGFSGCGDNVNSLPPTATTADYTKESQDKMKNMYGGPKPEKSTSLSASDKMRSMYPGK